MARGQRVVARQRREVALRAVAGLLVQKSRGRAGEGLEALEAGEHEREDGEDVEEDALEAGDAELLVQVVLGLVVVAGGEQLVLDPRHGRR